MLKNVCWRLYCVVDIIQINNPPYKRWPMSNSSSKVEVKVIHSYTICITKRYQFRLVIYRENTWSRCQKFSVQWKMNEYISCLSLVNQRRLKISFSEFRRSSSGRFQRAARTLIKIANSQENSEKRGKIFMLKKYRVNSERTFLVDEFNLSIQFWTSLQILK